MVLFIHTACDVSCTGAGICASILPEDCCNFFNLDDVCVIECPDGQLPNDDNECSGVLPNDDNECLGVYACVH